MMLTPDILYPMTSNNSNQTISKKFGYVFDVILDDEHERVKNSKNGLGADLIGCVLIKYSTDAISDQSNLTVAYPLDKNFKSLPIKNEIVEIYTGIGGIPLYRRVGIDVTPNIGNISTNLSGINLNNSNSNQKESYKEVSNTGISNTNKNSDSKLKTFGEHFSPTGIHKLKLNEGDLLIESRFGQSIRFSSYNNTKKTFSPTIIIRNRENTYVQKTSVIKSINEDVNSDGSVIVLSSNDYELGFVPGNVNDKNVGDMTSKPSAFQDYPTKLIGDQILLNSGRVIISSKTGEMIFYSKKNYGFISDGTFSIDNGGGIEASVGADINVVTNDNDFAIHSGNGSIFLGSRDLEPIVKGQQLVNILAELIDAIAEQQYLTPSGPTKIGPENIQTFSSIKTKLNNILSKLNQTS